MRMFRSVFGSGALVGLAVILSTFSIAAQSRPPQERPLGPRSVVKVSEEEWLTDAQGQPVRRTWPGEIMVVEKVEGRRVLLQAAISSVAGGWLPINRVQRVGFGELGNFRRRYGQLSREMFERMEKERLEKRKARLQELLVQESKEPLPLQSHPAVPTGLDAQAVVSGLIRLGQDTFYVDSTVQPDGSLLILGGANNLNNHSLPIAPRVLGGEGDASQMRGFHALVRFAPGLKEVRDFVIFPSGYLHGVTHIVSDRSGAVYLGLGLWPEVKPDEDRELFNRADPGQRALVKINPELTEVEWVTTFPPRPRRLNGMDVDPWGRVVFALDHASRYSKPELRRLFANGVTERPWRQWQGGADRILLDFRLDFWKEQFGPWMNKTMVYPKLATPMGKFGIADNTGEPIKWTNTPGASNPIQLGHFWLQGVLAAQDGRVFAFGSIPHNMPNPDFDPFMICFGPEGEVQWINVPIEGLLSEPDQPFQAAALDPRNGDVIASWWEHGENVNTLIKDPNGLIPAYNGKSGNMKSTWIGRFDRQTGRLKAATYFFAKKPNSFSLPRPEWNSFSTESIAVLPDGRVAIAANSARTAPVTPDAWIGNGARAGAPVLAVFTPDLSSLIYSSYLNRRGGKALAVQALPDGTVVVLGTSSYGSVRSDGAVSIPGLVKPGFRSSTSRDDRGILFFAKKPGTAAQRMVFVWDPDEVVPDEPVDSSEVADPNADLDPKELQQANQVVPVDEEENQGSGF